MKTKQLTLAALSGAVLCVFSPLSIPISPVPISLSTFAVYLICGIFDKKTSFLGVLIFIFLGAAGLPVFSGFRGGIGVIIGATGGYIAGYLPCALITSGMRERAADNQFIYVAGMLSGTASCYIVGTAWFYMVTSSSAGYALSVCVLPFVLADLVKVLCAALLAPRIRGRIK